MEFKLYCTEDPRSLGIEEATGHWDLVKFKDHVESCPACKRFLSRLTSELFNYVVAVCMEPWLPSKAFNK